MSPAHREALLDTLGDARVAALAAATLEQLAGHLTAIGMDVAQTPRVSKQRLPYRGGCCIVTRAVADPAGGNFDINALVAVCMDFTGTRPVSCVLQLTATRTAGGVLRSAQLGRFVLSDDDVDLEGVGHVLLNGLERTFPGGASCVTITQGAENFGRTLLEALTP